jgi:CxxC-x17-CxxC domain-containing protein
MVIRFLDKTLVCEDCGNDFTWSAGEQEFYAVMGFDNDPKRCPECRKIRRYGKRRPPIEYEIVCPDCGKTATVPFVPKENRPVYCRECFEARALSESESAVA